MGEIDLFSVKYNNYIVEKTRVYHQCSKIHRSCEICLNFAECVEHWDKVVCDKKNAKSDWWREIGNNGNK